MINQLILNGILLPRSSHDRYSCWEEDLSVQVDMISGRRVIESRGKVWKASYQFDTMGNEKLRQVLSVLRSGAPFIATVLPDINDEPVTSTFLVESITQPTFAFEADGKAVWHNLGFTLREEEPHD